MQLLTVLGARPQFTKAAFVSRAMAATQGGGRLIVEQILYAGPHQLRAQWFLRGTWPGCLSSRLNDGT